jgi:hypothetical protein
LFFLLDLIFLFQSPNPRYVDALRNRARFHHINYKKTPVVDHFNYQFEEYPSSRQIGTPKSSGYFRFSLGFTYYWLNDYAKAIEQ